MKPFAVLLLAIGLAGCGPDPKELPPVVLSSPPPTPSIAGECTSADPDWVELPDADARRSSLARNYRVNKTQYRALIAKRRVCRASLAVQFPRRAGQE